MSRVNQNPVPATISATANGCKGWAGSAAIKPGAADGGGLKGQALRALTQPRHWETDATLRRVPHCS